jgi:hypothetical protein
VTELRGSNTNGPPALFGWPATPYIDGFIS